MKEQMQDLKSEKVFLHSTVIESKRQNKLLKLAIGRLTDELDEIKGSVKTAAGLQNEESKFFVTKVRDESIAETD